MPHHIPFWLGAHPSLSISVPILVGVAATSAGLAVYHNREQIKELLEDGRDAVGLAVAGYIAKRKFRKSQRAAAAASYSGEAGAADDDEKHIFEYNDSISYNDNDLQFLRKRKVSNCDRIENGTGGENEIEEGTSKHAKRAERYQIRAAKGNAKRRAARSARGAERRERASARTTGANTNVGQTYSSAYSEVSDSNSGSDLDSELDFLGSEKSSDIHAIMYEDPESDVGVPSRWYSGKRGERGSDSDSDSDGDSRGNDDYKKSKTQELSVSDLTKSWTEIKDNDIVSGSESTSSE